MIEKDRKNTQLVSVEIYYLDWRKVVLHSTVPPFAALRGAGYLPKDFYSRVVTLRVPWNPADPMSTLNHLWVSFNSKKGEQIARGIREMCIGDFVTLNGTSWFCDFAGWTPLACKKPLTVSENPADYPRAGDKFLTSNEIWEFTGAEWQLVNNNTKAMDRPAFGLVRMSFLQDPDAVQRELEAMFPKKVLEGMKQEM